MAQFSIDSFTFLSFDAPWGRGGAPLLPHEMIEDVQRSGVNGTGFIRLGVKGFRFPMISRVDVPDELTAQSLIENYRSVAGSGLLNIVWRDVDYGSVHGVKYVCVGVTEDRLEVMANIIGGLNVPAGNPGVIVHCTWHLVPVVEAQ